SGRRRRSSSSKGRRVPMLSISAGGPATTPEHSGKRATPLMTASTRGVTDTTTTCVRSSARWIRSTPDLVLAVPFLKHRALRVWRSWSSDRCSTTGGRDMTPLDPLTVPLRGTQLIEASAGTGKTYAITNLYVRLLLEVPLAVSQILVVTYTNAATAELRARVRHRLRQALEAFDAAGSADEFLDRLVR